MTGNRSNQDFPDGSGHGLQLETSRVKAVNQAFVDLNTGSVDSASLPEGAILVIEDCEPLLFYLNSALVALGYKDQFLAGSLAEAQAVWCQHRQSISHVLLNYELPDGLAFEFAAMILAERPDLNVIVTSGYDVASIRESASSALQFQFLQKPFRLSELKDALEAPVPVRALSVSRG